MTDGAARVLEQITNRPTDPRTDVYSTAVVLRGLAREPEDCFEIARETALAIERATPLASAAQTNELVATSCGSSISAKQRLIASVEARTSSMRADGISLVAVGVRPVGVGHPLPDVADESEDTLKRGRATPCQPPARSCLAMTMRCTSLVPSPISQIFASRRCRSTANSRV